MSVFHNDMLAGSGGQGGGASSYQIARSLRFNSADGAYLSRTPSATSTSSTTCTLSFWMKRTFIGNNDRVFSLGPLTGVVNTFVVQISSDTIGAYLVTNTSYSQFTSAVLRDPSAWYHILFSLDTTQATASNRCRIYINGVQQASLTGTAPPQNHSINWGTGNTYYIGGDGLGGSYFSGYLADIHFIDGQALTPSSFGETDSNGVWQPKAYTGSYGTNGFRLDFSDNSSATSTGIGKDASGNGNNWTPNNVSVTAGSGNDSLVDSPTNYGTDTGAGGEVRGNYATGNTLFPINAAYRSLSNGNLDWSYTNGSNTAIIPATIFVSSGKWYSEFSFSSSVGSGGRVGIINQNCIDAYVGQTSNGYGYRNDGAKLTNASSSSYGSSWTIGDIIGVALDMDNGTLAFYKNGVSQGTAYTGISGQWTFAVDAFSGTCSANFGQRPFAYAAPSGFKALCTQNLPTPTILNGRTAMDVVTYTGNGGTQTISGLGFAPDLVWLKSRSAATAHEIVDIVRGATLSISSNTTSAEATDSNGLTAFTSSGFSLGTDSNYNNNATTYVAWAWDAGTTTVTNTAGTITSQVRANASAGISIVAYTGTGSAGSIGHGLGVAPKLYIVKNRSAGGTFWAVLNTILGSFTYLQLESTAAPPGTPGQAAPTSTVIYNLGDSITGANGNNYIMYCFAPVSGFSAFGSYTGNGSADGVFVYTGFRPRWVLVKKTSASGPWIIYDTARNPSNVADKELRPNTSEQENGGTYLGLIDIVSNGFKIRSNTSAYVGETGDFIYAAFAENPFSIARAR